MSSAPPVASVHSGMEAAQSFRHEYGRDLNNQSEVYRLAADAEELDRLDKQYEMFCKVMGRYPPPVAEILTGDAFGGDNTKAVLDLGCGSGIWIMDVAREFPQCTAVAVDLIPMQSVSMPPNCRSEVDDINFGLEHFYGKFDVVHSKLISSGVEDYQNLIDKISHILRPGGLIDVSEFAFVFYGRDKEKLSPPPGTVQPPWAPLWMSLANAAVKKRGGSADASLYLHSWVSEHPAFVVYREWWMPCSPWLEGDDPDTQFWNGIGLTMRDDVLAFMRSGRPLLLSGGLSEEFVDDIMAKAQDELMEAKTPIYVHVQNVYARKKHT
ncbi:hypothetical protein SERLA73DRAFT_82854 [Serpula lacrymans var. lacrymans S7.3]|uniref:Methyltransferase domain-containing protein n=1 Tax=Serpula lacrymans var. lacrymans (strain S7.3) TaxID=936435 RepID=F8PF74_SERL3|nr:hypothetical protein SERLA73DRAFT_82854 [Serpula lacrymans var. lacrymans S7.3]